MTLTMLRLSDQKLTDALNAGAVGVIPTDTIYGLACRAANKKAVARIYSLKSRERKPGTLIASSTDQLVDLGVPARYLKAVAHYWPGSISIILPVTPELNYIDSGLGLAIRIPSDESLVNLLEKTGPLLTSSANHPGKPPANVVEEAEKYFGDRVDFYVDGGDLSGRPPSTIIKVVDDEVVVIRQGAVKINELGEIEK